MPLLAAVVATALLSAGAAGATLLPATATCQGLGTGITCDLTALPDVFEVSDGSDTLFSIVINPSTVVVRFDTGIIPSPADLVGVGFRLGSLRTVPDEAVLITAVINTPVIAFVSVANSVLFATNDGGTPNTATIEWTDLAGTDLVPLATGAQYQINLDFVPVPEPGTAALLGLGLAGLCVVGRSRREESEGTG